MISFKATVALVFFWSALGYVIMQFNLDTQIFNKLTWLSIVLYFGYHFVYIVFPYSEYEKTTKNGHVKITYKGKLFSKGEYTYLLKLTHNESNVRAVDSLKNSRIGKYHIFPEPVEYYCLARGTIIPDEYDLMKKFFETMLNNE